MNPTAPAVVSTHAPRILFLYGSLRQRSYSRLLAEEAARIITEMGAETRFFDPRELPLADSVAADHPKVTELREMSTWSEGQVWCSPERHGAVTGVLKNQIDWIPLAIGAVRPTQGRTLAVMQVSGGSQSFNAVNTLLHPAVLLELLVCLGDRGLIRDREHAHPSPEKPECVHRVERLRAAAHLHDGERSPLRRPYGADR